MSFRFSPEDFEKLPYTTDDEVQNLVAWKANELLDAHITTLPSIALSQDGRWYGSYVERVMLAKARLWGIEEIAQKKCEHRGRMLNASVCVNPGIDAECTRCGKRLVAKWEEA